MGDGRAKASRGRIQGLLSESFKTESTSHKYVTSITFQLFSVVLFEVVKKVVYGFRWTVAFFGSATHVPKRNTEKEAMKHDRENCLERFEN